MSATPDMGGGQMKYEFTLEWYEKFLHGDEAEAMDAFYAAAAEKHENISYVYMLLNTERPESGCSHGWNMARSAMSAHIDKVNEAMCALTRRRSRENAHAFASAAAAIGPAMKIARDAMFHSKLKRLWHEVSAADSKAPRDGGAS